MKQTGLTPMYYARNLKLVERNKEWLGATGIGYQEKISYYGHLLMPYITQQKKVHYLGRSFYYDNIATPLNLQNYPYEISNKIIAHMGKPPKTVLDIGGNIGQFSLTMNHVLGGKAKIDVFEPNAYVFEILKRNVATCKNISIFNYGLSHNSKKQTLHYDKNRTCIGSVIEANAGVETDSHEDIAMTNKPELLTKRASYDLVKVDVEGYEYHAIKGLRGVSFKYLYIELSAGRDKDYCHSELFDEVRKNVGKFDLIFCSGLKKGDTTFECLIRKSSVK